MAEIRLISDKWVQRTGEHVLQYEVVPGDGETISSVECSYQWSEVVSRFVTVKIPATKDSTSLSITASVTKDEKTSTVRTEFNVAGDTTAPEQPVPSLSSWSAVPVDYVDYDQTINGAADNNVNENTEFLNRIANNMARNFKNIYGVGLDGKEDKESGLGLYRLEFIQSSTSDSAHVSTFPVCRPSFDYVEGKDLNQNDEFELFNGYFELTVWQRSEQTKSVKNDNGTIDYIYSARDIDVTVKTEDRAGNSASAPSLVILSTSDKAAPYWQASASITAETAKWAGSAYSTAEKQQVITRSITVLWAGAAETPAMVDAPYASTFIGYRIALTTAKGEQIYWVTPEGYLFKGTVSSGFMSAEQVVDDSGRGVKVTSDGGNFKYTFTGIENADGTWSVTAFDSSGNGIERRGEIAGDSAKPEFKSSAKMNLSELEWVKDPSGIMMQSAKLKWDAAYDSGSGIAYYEVKCNGDRIATVYVDYKYYTAEDVVPGAEEGDEYLGGYIVRYHKNGGVFVDEKVEELGIDLKVQNGDYEYTVQAFDRALNPSSNTISITLYGDDVKPELAAPAAGLNTADKILTLAWNAATDKANSTVNAKPSGVEYYAVSFEIVTCDGITKRYNLSAGGDEHNFIMVDSANGADSYLVISETSDPYRFTTVRNASSPLTVKLADLLSQVGSDGISSIVWSVKAVDKLANETTVQSNELKDSLPPVINADAVRTGFVYEENTYTVSVEGVYAALSDDAEGFGIDRDSIRFFYKVGKDSTTWYELGDSSGGLDVRYGTAKDALQFSNLAYLGENGAAGEYFWKVEASDYFGNKCSYESQIMHETAAPEFSGEVSQEITLWDSETYTVRIGGILEALTDKGGDDGKAAGIEPGSVYFYYRRNNALAPEWSDITGETPDGGCISVAGDYVDVELEYGAEYEFTVSAKDKFGNTLSAGDVTFAPVGDNVAPDFNIAGYDGTWKSGSVQLTVMEKVAVPENGKYDGAPVSYSYSLNEDGRDATAIPMSDRTGSFKVSESGTYWIIATDKAGNSRKQKIEVKIDNSAPADEQISISVEKDGSIGAWTESATVMVSFEWDEKSPITCSVLDGDNVIASVEYSGDDSALPDGWRFLSASKKLVYSVTVRSSMELKAEMSDQAHPDVIATAAESVTGIDGTAPEAITLEVSDADAWAQSKAVVIGFGKYDGNSKQTCSVVMNGTVYEAVVSSGGIEQDGSGFSMDENGVISFRMEVSENTSITASAVDEAGNKAAAVTGDVTKIDTEKPAAPELVPDTVTAAEAVLITVKVSPETEGGAPVVVKYQLNGGEVLVWDGVNPIRVGQNGTFRAWCEDAAGNVSEEDAALEIRNIVSADALETPILTRKESTAGWTADDVVLILKSPLSNGLAKVVTYYVIDGQEYEWDGRSEISVSKNCTVSAYCQDELGNRKDAEPVEIGNIDKIAPAVPRLIPSTTDWTKGPVTITLDAAVQDGGSPLTTEYSCDGGKSWQVWTGEPFEVSANCTVLARTRDEAHDWCEPVELNVSCIVMGPLPEPSLLPDTTVLTNRDVLVTISGVSASHDGAPVMTRFSCDGGKTWNVWDGVSPVTVKENCVVQVYSEDAVGNRTGTVSLTVGNIDKIAPEQPAVQASTTEKTNQTVTLTPSFAADSAKNEFSFDGRTWSEYTAPVVLAANATVYFRSTDAAGNSSVTSFPVTNIYPDPDNTQPEVNPNNNSKESPTFVAPTLYGDVELRSRLTPDDNADAYSFTGNRIGNLTISMAELAPGAKVRVTVYADDRKMKSVTLKGNGNNIFKLPVVGSTVVVENMTKGKQYTATAYKLNINGDFFPDPTVGDETIYSANISSIQVSGSGNGDSGYGISGTGWVGIRDAVDCYRVDMANAGMLTLNVYDVTAKLKVTLYDGDGKKLKSKTISGGTVNLFRKPQLVKDSKCYIQVESGDKGKGKQNTTYRLEINQDYFPAATADNSFDAANAVNTSGTGSVSGWVGVKDSIDFYKLNFLDAAGNASQMGTLSFSIRDVSSKLKVTLYDANRNVIRSVSVSKAKNDLFKPQTLNGGAAYLSVESGDQGKGRQNSYYTLDIQGTIYPPAVEYNRNGMLA